jgi:hypothetical protein
MENAHNWIVLKFGETSEKSLQDWCAPSKRIKHLLSRIGSMLKGNWRTLARQ